MGRLINGCWRSSEHEIIQGEYLRASSAYDEDIDIAVSEAIRSTPGRYYLIASMSCQWSQRTLITRLLKGLESNLPMHIAYGERVEGYAANGGKPWQVPGSRRQIKHLHQLYSLSDQYYTGSATVPILWDSEQQHIISNESAKIQRALDATSTGENRLDFTLVPTSHLCEIEQINRAIYTNLSNAVYRAGFAQTQTAYDEAVEQVFAQLDWLEGRLTKQRYLIGNLITEADINLFSTLIRFDQVYFVLHRCCRHRLVDYPHLWAYARDIYAWPGVADTVDFTAIREGSYHNDTTINPYRIVAVADDANWQLPHQRESLGPACVINADGESIEVDAITFRPSRPMQ